MLHEIFFKYDIVILHILQRFKFYMVSILII